MASNSATLATIKTAYATRAGHPTYGEISFSGNGSTTVFNIPHGAGGSPNNYWALPISEAATGKHTVTRDGTNIVITFTTAPVSGTNNVKFRWGSHRL